VLGEHLGTIYNPLLIIYTPLIEKTAWLPLAVFSRLIKWCGIYDFPDEILI